MALDALCFGAHPDDIELSCGGLAARLAANGHSVGLVDLTRGERASRGDIATRAREAAEDKPDRTVKRDTTTSDAIRKLLDGRATRAANAGQVAK